ncbi:DeoR family transcriptional regulator [Bacillus sp. FSL K6-3431]|uniref:DeoR family transcriptional regulator n=1 Tax=Bacillus sp. FSL K6-3431 TaxID=2921500 RepID=UPI0030FB034B
MLPIERQQQILTWLKQEETLRISEISNRLNVSEMTVYRDLKPLIDKKKVLKTSNGITLSVENYASSNTCTYCHKPSNSRLSVQLIKVNQQVENTCCAHCGLLRYQDIKQDVAQIICHDFLKDTTISAKMAAFVMDADLALNCCQPQVIPFDSLHQAEQFQLGFGGNIYNFENAINAINIEMNGKTSCHSKKE